jgi:hypothetical protein
VTKQVFVREHCTMIAAPVQCDVDGIPKGSHYGRAAARRESAVFDPLHYLRLLEHKSRALEQAAPLADWQLPDDDASG